MHCLLVLAMLSLSSATEVLYNEDKVAVEENEMMPEKDSMLKKEEKDLILRKEMDEEVDLVWRKETKMEERRSEPPPYMFNLLEKYSKEGMRGYVRSILPVRGRYMF